MKRSLFTPKSGRKFKPVTAWLFEHEGGYMSSIVTYTEEQLRKSKCVDKCQGIKGRYIKVRITEAK